MSSKSSHVKCLNDLSRMISDKKNRSFKSSLIVTGKFRDASDDEIDKTPEL